MDFQAEVLHRSPFIGKHHWSRVVGKLAFRLGVAEKHNPINLKRFERSDMKRAVSNKGYYYIINIYQHQTPSYCKSK